MRADCMKCEVEHCICFFLCGWLEGSVGIEVFKKWSGGGQLRPARGLDQGRWEGAAADRS